MKNSAACHLLVSLGLLLALSGCETLQFGSSQLTDEEISPLKTFAVAKVTGSVDQILASDAPKVRELTQDAIITQLEKKGYALADEATEPDFTVYAQWMITTQNNWNAQLNSGNVETASQVPALAEVASVAISVQIGSSGAFVWRNESPWPFKANAGNEADVRNSVRWALDNFPVHQASQAPAN